MKKYLLISLLISFLLFLSSSLAVGYLTISWQVLDSEVRPGGETTVFLNLTNPSATERIKTIKLYISPGPYITSSTNYVEIGGLDTGETQQTSLILKISSSAVSTTSYLKVRASYYADSTQKETIVNIPITIRRVPILQISNIEYNTSLIEPGSIVLLTFDLKNNGDGSAKDVKIVLNQTPKTFIVEQEESFLEEIGPEESKNISFIITLDPSISVGTYSIPLSLTYLDETRTEDYSFTKYVGLTVSGEPKLTVSTEEVENFYQGGKGEISISIANVGTSDAEFLTVKVSGLGVEKEAYVGTLDSDDYDMVSFNIDLKNVKSGKYSLDLILEYKDPYNKEFSEEKTIEVEVSQRPLEIPLGVQIILVLIVIGILYWKREFLIGLFKK
jgi:hypothetical protein